MGVPTYCFDQFFPKSTWKWKGMGGTLGSANDGERFTITDSTTSTEVKKVWTFLCPAMVASHRWNALQKNMCTSFLIHHHGSWYNKDQQNVYKISKSGVNHIPIEVSSIIHNLDFCPAQVCEIQVEIPYLKQVWVLPWYYNIMKLPKKQIGIPVF